MRYDTDSFFLLVSRRNINTRYSDISKYRVKIAISSKIVKTAVKRNKVKRLIREVLRAVNSKKADTGKEIIIGVKKDLSSENYNFFSKEILNLFNKAKLLK